MLRITNDTMDTKDTMENSVRVFDLCVRCVLRVERD
jgi:coenzyme F420-reducing hydrogenase alpha subunit